MTVIIATTRTEGFIAPITLEVEGQSERVWFDGDADIDFDGANGMNGQPAAYMVGDKGLEYLANGGMAMHDGHVIGIEDWFRDIVILGANKQPQVFPGGVIASKTSYRFPGKSLDDPSAYLDAATVPYIVVPPVCLEKTRGAVLGCLARATHLKSGRTAVGVVGDVGPRSKVGEISAAMAELLHIPNDRHGGGIDGQEIRYECCPGVPGEVNCEKIALMTMKGGYINA